MLFLHCQFLFLFFYSSVAKCLVCIVTTESVMCAELYPLLPMLWLLVAASAAISLISLSFRIFHCVLFMFYRCFPYIHYTNFAITDRKIEKKKQRSYCSNRDIPGFFSLSFSLPYTRPYRARPAQHFHQIMKKAFLAISI